MSEGIMEKPQTVMPNDDVQEAPKFSETEYKGWESLRDPGTQAVIEKEDAKALAIPISELDGSKAQPAPPPEPAPAPEPQKADENTPWARIRILEKEKKSLKKQSDERIDKLERMLADATSKLDKLVGATQPGEETPQRADPNTEPVRHLIEEVQDIKRDLEEKKAQEARAQYEYVVGQAIGAVNSVIQEQIRQDPVFAAGIEHLSEVIEGAAQLKFPDASDEKLREIVAMQVNEEKLKWARENRDPVEQMYRLAMAYGFKPEEVAQRIKAQAAPKPQAKPQIKVDLPPAKEIEAAQKRRIGTGTIAGLQGVSPKGFSADAMRGKSASERQYEFAKLEREGALKIRPGKRAPDLEVMLAGKLIETP